MDCEYDAVPVRHWVFDDWATPPFPEPPGDTWPGWEAVYDNDCESGKRTARDLRMLAAYPELLNRMRSAGTEWTERLGYPVVDDDTLHGGGLHVTKSGGWLNCHLDYARHPIHKTKRRALNLILFVHPRWHREWGGYFYLADPSGKPVVWIEPRPGRLLAFETGSLSYHGVHRVVGPEPRVSLAVYYLADATEHDTRTRALFIPNRG